MDGDDLELFRNTTAPAEMYGGARYLLDTVNRGRPHHPLRLYAQCVSPGGGAPRIEGVLEAVLQLPDCPDGAKQASTGQRPA